MKEIVFLNGEFIPREEARISPDDRGFIFADGVYEVIKYYQGIPFCFEGHIERLKYSLSQVSMPYVAIDKLKAIMQQLIEANQLAGKEAGVYLQITRGAAPRTHYFTEDAKPTLYMFAFPFQANAKQIKQGINVLVEKDIRWQRCDIKSVSLLPNIMLYNKAHIKKAGEVILTREGWVTEATHSSVLGVMNGAVYTHPLNNHVLPGITRKVALGICRENHIDVVEEAMSEDMLGQVDELMIVGTGSEITPVVSIQGKPIKDGKPGEITKFLQKEFYKKVGH